MWLRIFFVLLAAFFVWETGQYLQKNPDALSEDKIKRGLPALGLIAAFLIVVLIAACWVLKRYVT